MLFTIYKMFPENTVEQYMEYCFSGRFFRKCPKATGRLKGKYTSRTVFPVRKGPNRNSCSGISV